MHPGRQGKGDDLPDFGFAPCQLNDGPRALLIEDAVVDTRRDHPQDLPGAVSVLWFWARHLRWRRNL